MSLPSQTIRSFDHGEGTGGFRSPRVWYSPSNAMEQQVVPADREARRGQLVQP